MDQIYAHRIRCVECQEHFRGRKGQRFCSVKCRVRKWGGGKGGVVYAILDSGTGEVRYVGQTVGLPMGRLDSHKRGGNLAFSNWLAGNETTVVVLEEVASWKDLHRTESMWMRKMRRQGNRLFNRTGLVRLSRLRFPVRPR